MAVVSDVTVRLRLDLGDFDKSLGDIQKNVTDNLMPVQKGLSAISETMGQASKAIIGFGKDSYMGFAEFERGISKVSALAGITGEPLDQLRDKAKELGKTTEFTSKEVVDAFQSMALAGWEQADMMEAVSSALDLATITGLDFGNTTSYLINALAPFGKSASDAQMVVDLFAKTATSANFNINDLAKSFEYVAPIAGSMGYAMEDVNVALALLANNGLKGSKAGTALRRILTDLNSKADEGVISIEGYSVAISNADGTMRPLTDVLKDMSVAFDGLTQSQKAQYAEQLVGKTGMAGFLALMEQGTEGIDEMTAKVYDYNGAGAEMAGIIRSDQMGSMEALKSAFEAVQLKIGEVLDKAVTPFIDGLTSLARWFASLPEPVQTVVVALGGMVVAFTALVAVVASGMAIWTAFSMVMGTALLPILSVIAGIVALGAVIIYLWNTSEGFRSACTNLWNAIKDVILSVCGVISDFWAEWGENIKAVTVLIWDTIKSKIEFVINTIAEIIRIITNIIKGDWSAVWDSIVNIVQNFLQMAVNTVTNLLNIMFNTVGKVVGNIANFFRDKFKAVYDFICNPIEKAKEFFGKQIDKMKSFLNFQWEFPKLKMPHFRISGSMNPLKWFDEGVPKISVEWYAKGGIFSNANVIGVGERGAEAVVPLNNKTKVRPFAQAITAEMGATGGAGGGLTINVGELVVREEADIRKVAQELYRLQQYKSRGRGSW